MERSPPTTSPAVQTRCEDWGKGIRQLQEAIWRGSLKLRVLNKEWAHMRRKSVILGEGRKKLETSIAQAGRVKLSMMRPGLADPTMTLEIVATMLSWL